jgi:exonuclease SbcC
MKILKISGKNLASLAGEFSVDFEQEPLASAGLFAISGPTGAGKSTLLDALCLALYDATPRLLKITRGASLLPDVGDETVSAQDPRTLLRRGAAEAHAEVDFVGNDGGRYRARWSVRRARTKAAGGLQKSNMTLLRLPDLIALGGTKTEVLYETAQRIGLSFEQFTRAVLLAQNEFSAFLKTEENERGELLETLTGSAIYTVISKRAFERYKMEQSAMQQLTARLADQTPLEAEARAAIDGQGKVADTALAAIDERKTGLEQQLRWHQEADKLRQNEVLAEEARKASVAEVESAAARRRRLATLDAVQPARQLMAETIRLDAENVNIKATIAAGEEQLRRAVMVQQDTALAAETAASRLQAAEEAQRTAAPQLDQAKALDASIAALAPSHRQAAETRDAARREADLARESAQAKAAELATTREAYQAGAAWLTDHRHWETLAAQWPRWDKLFAQAEQAAALDLAHATALANAQQAERQAADKDTKAAAALAASAQQLQTLEGSRQQAIAALAAFDAEQLRDARQALEQRREGLASGEKIWTELTQTRNRWQQALAQAAQLNAARAAAETALNGAIAAASALQAAFGQAERSLRAAELACADSVEDLRATLADDHPCPVCGSNAHPYRQQNDSLHAMLASLEEQVAACRTKVHANLSAQAAQRAIVAASDDQLAAIERDGSALTASLARIAAAWDTHALAAEAPPDLERGGWLTAQLDALRAKSRELDAQEQAARRASQARDTAQAACDKAGAEHARLQELAVTARAALAKASAEHAALAEKRAHAATSLAELLGELDAAFSAASGDMFDSADASEAAAWKAEWQRDPAPFRAARAADAQLWTGQSSLHAQRAASIATLEVEHRAATGRLDLAARTLSAADAEFARTDADIRAKQLERKGLWDGKPVQEVQHGLAAAIDAAKAALAAQQAASQQAAHAETRAREALAHGNQRLAAIATASDASAKQLAAWLAAFATLHPELEPVADAAQLAALLDRDPGWVAQERDALNQLDARAASAATVLAERRAQREQHQHGAAHDPAQSASSLAEALRVLLDERKAAHESATALRLQIAQDNARREHAHAMMAEIEKQQLVERRWGRLSELIGSSDGKKFRNYAQQFTLDVLLGYANSHLAQLARRYRLERVINLAGPSLGLMVRDQDMGGEVRSVNSLSGGESFLVSLALALGLASLSSNRVRVESLFIDEGFGSLDSETLRVAMDALDGLQSMGRKVGVISHVQEMTERIAAKILVLPSGGGTSSVTVQ